jgi:hypothetical protein
MSTDIVAVTNAGYSVSYTVKLRQLSADATFTRDTILSRIF